MEVKDQIKRRVSITDVAALYVDLKPAGKYLKALCPFHTEKTPSFIVMPDKDTFTCYGCNKFGDIFTLIQEMESLTFPEAMNFLIEKFNIPVERTGQHKTTPTTEYASINELALKHFRENLSDSPEGKQAQEYLQQRGISGETIETFKLGYALNQWEGLYANFRQQKVNIDKAVELGLLINNPQRNSVYDRFRGRVIFPIFSETGALIAFGGRTIFDDPAKYLNSPDTPLYKKSNHLYGFNLAKQAAREQKKCILVEGYFDVVSLHQNGVKYAAASLGTALTEQQIYLLKRFAENIYIWYDSDKAGITAAVRGIEKMFEQNINPRIILSTDVKDPDDFIKEKGLEAFQQQLKDATEGFRFLVHQVTLKYNFKIPEQKKQAVESIMGFVSKFNDAIIRDEYIRMVADIFDVDEKLLQPHTKHSDGSPAAAPVTALNITPAERIFLQSLFTIPEFIEEIKSVINDKLLSVLSSRNIIRLLFEHYNPHTKDFDDFNRMVQQLNEPERIEFRDIFKSRQQEKIDRADLEEKILNSVDNFVKMFKEQEIKRLARQIKAAERDNNIQEVMRLMNEKNKYIKQKYQRETTGGSVEIL